MPETEDGMQGLPQKPAPVRWQCLGARASGAPAGGNAGAPRGWQCLGARASGAHTGDWLPRTQGMAVPGSARLRRAHRRL